MTLCLLYERAYQHLGQCLQLDLLLAASDWPPSKQHPVRMYTLVSKT